MLLIFDSQLIRPQHFGITSAQPTSFQGFLGFCRRFVPGATGCAGIQLRLERQCNPVVTALLAAILLALVVLILVVLIGRPRSDPSPGTGGSEVAEGKKAGRDDVLDPPTPPEPVANPGRITEMLQEGKTYQVYRRRRQTLELLRTFERFVAVGAGRGLFSAGQLPDRALFLPDGRQIGLTILSVGW